MSWYQENKFAGTLLGVTVVVSGVLIYLGMSANSEASDANKKEKAAVTKINTLQSAMPYPNKENEKLLKEELSSFAADTKSFQDDMLKFRPEQMTKISADAFTGELTSYIKKLTGYYESKGINFPKDTVPYFGMEEYKSTMAPEDSTAYLNYHRLALEWLFTTLADSGIDTLNSVYRAPVAEALGEKPKVAVRAKPKRKRSKRGKKSQPVGLTSVHDGLPVEIIFTGTEAVLQKFIADVTAGDEYFFAIKLLKIVNEEQDPVTISTATFASAVDSPVEGEAPVLDDGVGDLGSFDLLGEEFEEEGGEIIKQVIGDEKITVFMELELVLLKGGKSVPIPSLKIEKSVKPVKKEVKEVSK